MRVQIVALLARPELVMILCEILMAGSAQTLVVWHWLVLDVLVVAAVQHLPLSFRCSLLPVFSCLCLTSKKFVPRD